MEKDKCLICELEAEIINYPAEVKQNNWYYGIRCPRCGDYIYELHKTKRLLEYYDKERKHILSAVVNETWRKYHRNEGSLVSIKTENDLKLLENSPLIPKDITEKAYKLLSFLKEKTEYPGKIIYISPSTKPYILSACYAANVQEASYFVDYLARSGWIQISEEKRSKDVIEIVTIKMTVEGFSEIAKREGKEKRLKQAFVAMSFTPGPEMDEVWERAIKPAVKGAGYIPFRVDKKEHNEKICDLILSEVPKSRFLIADLTYNKRGVYFEAGLAHGYKMPVIWCCKDEEKHKENMHFDTRQYNHIFWKDIDDLQERLKLRILGTVGQGTVSAV